MTEETLTRVTTAPARTHVATPIVALDVPTFAAAQELVQALGNSCDFYKVGLQLFSAEGPRVVAWLRQQGKQVFVDLKLHDIPNTVQSAARSIASLGASLVTVHASGGRAMIRAAVEGAGEGSLADTPCRVLAVTLLTSLNADVVNDAWGRSDVVMETEVVRLAGLTLSAGARGVVCSGRELGPLKQTYGDALAALVPGVRLQGGASHDQERVITPGEAMRAGADWLVLGRAVTAAPDPAAAMAAVWAELAGNPAED